MIDARLARSVSVDPTTPSTPEPVRPRRRRRLRALLRDQRGALGFVEIVVLFAVLIVVIALGASAFGQKVRGGFDQAGNTVDTLDPSIQYSQDSVGGGAGGNTTGINNAGH